MRRRIDLDVPIWPRSGVVEFTVTVDLQGKFCGKPMLFKLPITFSWHIRKQDFRMGSKCMLLHSPFRKGD